MTFLLVALCGGLGAATRFVVDELFRGRWAHEFPVATVAINVSGSGLLGLLTGASLYLDLPSGWLLVAGTGFCGGYTTFSTATVETVRLAQAGEYGLAAANAFGALALALGAVAAGIAVVWLLA
ncbi:fluoride efflux transporter FluC [Pengzhenrongella sicca]|uniref:Fluoride-specific ion channel FluC n=1 Tax=Pengzhenrongella sicca TaxID=2819238 RepID=A0A8A4ZMP4_9MICO|nr:CrcB family protein [Pengzhenrongella sicca]QTE30828.1 CrcB family protein [Pengzhenrongella sicca]